jgi:RNA polymerase sigma factor (sigma-70 family)
MKTKIEEQELIALLRARSQRGLRILYDNYSAALFGVISRIITDNETAEDVLQEAFVKIWNNIDNYDTSKGRLFTWLLNVARNQAIDKTRSKDFKDAGKVQRIEDSRITAALQLTRSGLKNLQSSSNRNTVSSSNCFISAAIPSRKLQKNWEFRLEQLKRE